MSIYVTGDFHGDMTRLLEFKLANLGKEDYIIVAGDFGLLWSRDARFTNAIELVKSVDYTVLWIDGNHENHDWIDSLPVSTWHGGKVHMISDNCIHLMRGQVYEIDGKSIFTFGGANSIDKYMRIPGVSWWEREEASREEMEEALDNLEKHNNKVDYIITHSASDTTLKKINPTFRKELTTTFLQTIEERCKFKHWYLGHYHEDREIDDKHTVLYYNVKQLK